MWLVAAGGLAVVLVVVGVVLGTTLGGGGGADTSALDAAGCTSETFASQGRKHVQELEDGFKYNSFPATSGPHYPTPAIWNIYTEPIEQIRAVHNLEHGGVIVQYGDKVPDETVAEITAWYESGDRNAILVAPLPTLGDKVALTAWTHLATCPGFDQKAFDSFLDANRYNGPERFPANAMQPGS